LHRAWRHLPGRTSVGFGWRAEKRRDRFPDANAAGELAALVERRRAELQRGALELAGRLFRKKPRKVVRPLEKSGAARLS
jgi:hypothetical protein